MTGLKMEIFGIGIILLGIAISMNNFWAYTLGVFGFGVIGGGLLYREKRK